MLENWIRFENVSYQLKDRLILNDINFSLPERGLTALMGPNGAGKTILIKHLLGLIRPQTGKITIGEHVVTAEHPLPPQMQRKIAMTLQQPVIFRCSVKENLKIAFDAARRAHRQDAGDDNNPYSQDENAIYDYLKMANLLNLQDTPARFLSGGEKQRLCIIRALISHPKLLLLDEPSSNLDPRSIKSIENLVTALANDGMKIILATHDIHQAKRISSDIIFLADGKLIEARDTPSFYQSPLSPIAQSYINGDLSYA